MKTISEVGISPRAKQIFKTILIITAIVALMIIVGYLQQDMPLHTK